MIECTPKWRLFLFLLLGFIFAGCGQFRRGTVEEEKEPQFLEAKKRAQRMDYDGAIKSYERALQANPDNAAAHLELGLLYDSKKNDFAAAIHHYQRHLTLRTNSPMANVLKDNIIACTRELAKSVRYAVVTRDVQRDLERLSQTNSLYKARIDFLEAELSRRPQYITNHVTNFVGLPQVDQRPSSSRLTQPTQLLPAPPEVQSAAPERTSDLAKSSAKAQTKTPKNAPRVGESRAPEPAPVRAAGTRAVHTVRPGETLAILAGRYGVSVQALRAANPAAAGGVRAGQKINIPK